MTELSDEAVPEQSEQLDLQPEEMLVDSGRHDDLLDGGYQVPDHWSAGQGFGNTPEEQAEGETLDQRLSQEEPEVGEEPLDNDVEDESDTLAGGSLQALSAGDLDEDSDGELFAGTESIDDGEVGDEQVVRLIEANEGTGLDSESEMLGLDADDADEQSAEEAAIHVVPES